MNVRFRCVLGVATVCVVFLMTEIVAASVTVDGGRVEGTVENGLQVYRGIPFAAPPKFLHTIIRVSDPAATVAFFQHLGLEERRRMDNEQGRFTLIFLGVPGDEGGELELTHNWDEGGYSGGRNFGTHLQRGSSG